MSLVWNTGIEGGVISANGGGIFSNLSGVPSVESSIKHSGNYAGRVSPVGAGAINCRKNLSASAQVMVARCYLYFPSGGLPGSTVNLFGSATNTSGISIGVNVKSDGVWRGAVGSGSTLDAHAVTTDEWHRVDIRIDIRTSTWTLDWAIDGVDQTQVSLTGQSTTDSLLYLRIGSASTTVTMDMIFDDVALSETYGDYKIAGDSTIALKPNADGTHNAGTNVIEDNTGADIGVVTAWDKLDDIPITGASNYIRQAANGTGNYAEISFEDMSVGHSAIQGATALLSYSSETTTSNTGSSIVSKDNFSTSSEIYGTAATPLDMSDGSTANPFYKSVVVAGAVDTSTVNAIKARLGYSNDASPDPYWLNLIIEVSYTASAGGSPIEGTLSKSQANNTLASSSALSLKGTLSKSQASNTLLSAAQLLIQGAAAKAQAGDSISASGRVDVKGSLSKTQDSDTLSSQALIQIEGTLSLSQASDTLSASAELDNSGQLDVTQSSDVLSSSAQLLNEGELLVTQEDNTLSASGSGVLLPIEGTLSKSQDDNAISAASTLAIEGDLSQSQADDTLLATSQLLNSGRVNTQADDNTLLAAGSVAIAGVLHVTQDDNISVITGTSPRAGLVVVVQDDNTILISATLLIRGSSNVSQASNSLLSSGRQGVIIEGPGRLDIITAEDSDTIRSERLDVIYADDINDL